MDKTILVFGDSIMYGSGNGGKGVGEYLQEKYGFSLSKYCVGGARVGFVKGKSWVVEQVRSAIEKGEKPDIIIFDGFTNDCNSTNGVPLGEKSEGGDIFKVTQDNDFSFCFASIVRALNEYFSKAQKLFIRPHKMGRRDAVLQVIYGERAVEICRNYGINVLDLYKDCDLDTFKESDRDEYTTDSYGWGRGDCTHPNALGYEKKYMPLIYNAVENLLKE